MSFDNEQTDTLFAQSLDFLKQVILSKGGTYSIVSLHGHIGQTSANLRQVLGKNPRGLVKFLKSLPDHFSLTKLENGDLLVSMYSREDDTKAGITLISWLMRDSDSLALDDIVSEILLAKPLIQQIIGTTKAKVRAFLQMHAKEFVVSGNLVWRRDVDSRPLDLSPERMEEEEEFLKSADPMMNELQYQAQVLPVHHRGPLKKLEKGFGIIYHTPSRSYICFGRHVLVTDSKYMDLTRIMQEGCILDCLFIPSELKQSCRYTAIRVWKVDRKEPRMEMTLAPLQYPLLYGTAKVKYSKSGVGFFSVVSQGQNLPNSQSKEEAELVIFHLQYCIVSCNLEVTPKARVHFLATKFISNKLHHRVWDCVRIWSWRQPDPLASTYKVLATLDIATREGGHLKLDTFPRTMAFHWETILASSTHGHKPVLLNINQHCVATVSTSASIEDQIIISLQLLDSFNANQANFKSCLSTAKGSDSRNATSASKEGFINLDEKCSIFDKLQFALTPLLQDIGSYNPRVIKGMGCIVSTDVFGGIVRSTCGAIVAFGPHCFYFGNRPACASFFPEGTSVSFEAMTDGSLATASKVWVEDNQ